MPPDGISCRQFVELIPDHREMAIGNIDEQRFEQHRADCARCADYLKGYEATVAVAKRSLCENENIPEVLVRRIVRAASKERN